MSSIDQPVLGEHEIRRVRHETRPRFLRVRRRLQLTPGMVRITFGGEDLRDFTSLGFDDHVKLFFPGPEQVSVPAADGAEAPRPPSRDYTPRRYDREGCELDVEFVLHGDGPAATWAAHAQPGAELRIGGPRGSMIVPTDFDWHLLAGDESGLPAICRRLEELPKGARAIIVVEVNDAADEQALASAGEISVTWLHRNGAEPGTTHLLEEAIARLSLPRGDGYAWVACETAAARVIRRHLIDQRGHDRRWIRAAGYWKRGAADVHENHND